VLKPFQSCVNFVFSDPTNCTGSPVTYIIQIKVVVCLVPIMLRIYK